MKRMLTLLLALVLCLSITACASEDEKALEAANALMEAGDYEGALEAYRSIAIYQQISEKILEAESQSITGKVAPYVGIWKDLNSSTVVTVSEDGTFNVTDDYNSWDGEVYIEDDTTIYLSGKLTRKVVDGIVHLVDSTQDLVSEMDYETLGAKPVEITMDNWETYFELKEATSVYSNDFGEAEHSSMGYGIFLRDEYAQKLLNNYSAVDVSFKYSYMQSFRLAEGDYPNDYTLGAERKFSWVEKDPQEVAVEVYLREGEHYALSDFNGCYAADLTANGWTTEGNKTYVMYPKDLQVLNVTGTLTLFP